MLHRAMSNPGSCTASPGHAPCLDDARHGETKAMEQLRDFSDERNRGFCCYCGGATGTRDHIPSKVLLDLPYPANLPVVPACSQCNQSFSVDEEYVACLVECAIVGSAEPGMLKRGRICRLLSGKPALAARLRRARSLDLFGNCVFDVEPDRVRRVILKLGQGHAAYELGEPRLEEPANVGFQPLTSMQSGARFDFEAPPATTFWPEVGSRAMQRMCAVGNPAWIEVQAGRYRYLVSSGPPVIIRMVLSEYLAGEVAWSES